MEYYASEKGIETAQGELIADQDNDVYLLAKEGSVVVPIANIYKAALSIYTNQKVLVGTWDPIYYISWICLNFFGSYLAYLWHCKHFSRISKRLSSAS